MELRSALLLGATAAAVCAMQAGGPAGAATAGRRATVAAPVCGGPTTKDFPIRTRLHGGPATYTGGGHRAFSLDLANTTTSACHGVHPVMVFVGRDRALAPPHIKLEYADPRTGGWKPVPFDHTDNDENVAVIGGKNGPGSAVPAGGTVTVRLRLRFTSGALPQHVIASATVMQRKGNDGDWAGESEPYTFDIVRARPPLAATGRREDVLIGLGAIGGGFLLLGGALVAGARRSGRR